jgi:flagellar operon protein
MNPNSIHQQGALALGLRANSPAQGLGDGAFKKVLDGHATGLAPSDLRFSSHASQRLESRGIELTDTQESRLASGVGSLRSKGVRDGLVVVDEHRFVVSAENKTVITVMSVKDREVFTNIQGVAFE